MSDEIVFVKTTKKDFAIFKKEVAYWIDRFGLHTWDVTYLHADIGACRGMCEAKLPEGIAYITLATEYDKRVYCEAEIRGTAFHEVCELLLSRLMINAKYRYSGETELDEASHAVIHVFERLRNIKALR